MESRAGRRSQLGNNCSFTGTNKIIKNDAIVLKKKHIERVLENIGKNYKRKNVEQTVIG